MSRAIKILLILLLLFLVILVNMCNVYRFEKYTPEPRDSTMVLYENYHPFQ